MERIDKVPQKYLQIYFIIIKMREVSKKRLNMQSKVRMIRANYEFSRLFSFPFLERCAAAADDDGGRRREGREVRWSEVKKREEKRGEEKRRN